LATQISGRYRIAENPKRAVDLGMSSLGSAIDMLSAASVVDTAKGVVTTAIRHLAAQAERADAAIDANQQVAYDLAHAASAVENARAVLDYGNKGALEAKIAAAFVADMAYDVTTKLLGRESEWGVADGAMDSAIGFIGR
jgi:(2S)-methylsuccinyl-CoA dehydrogenase